MYEELVKYNTERAFSWIIWIFFLHSDIVCRALYIWDNLVIIHYIMCLSGQRCLLTSASVDIFHQLVDFSLTYTRLELTPTSTNLIALSTTRPKKKKNPETRLVRARRIGAK